MNILQRKVFVQLCIIHHIMNKMSDYQCMNQINVGNFWVSHTFCIISLYVGRDKSYRTVKPLTVTWTSIMDTVSYSSRIVSSVPLVVSISSYLHKVKLWVAEIAYTYSKPNFWPHFCFKNAQTDRCGCWEKLNSMQMKSDVVWHLPVEVKALEEIWSISSEILESSVGKIEELIVTVSNDPQGYC